VGKTKAKTTNIAPNHRAAALIRAVATPLAMLNKARPNPKAFSSLFFEQLKKNC